MLFLTVVLAEGGYEQQHSSQELSFKVQLFPYVSQLSFDFKNVSLVPAII